MAGTGSEPSRVDTNQLDQPWNATTGLCAGFDFLVEFAICYRSFNVATKPVANGLESVFIVGNYRLKAAPAVFRPSPSGLLCIGGYCGLI
jgi:hypothetical protein